VRLLVTDTGLGLDAGQLAHLFEPFNRLGAEQTAVEGTGLGLTLSRRLVEAMGGTLTVTSAHGRGSTFSVALPAATAPAARQARAAALAAPAPAGPHRTVLYVEDNLANLRLVEEILADRPGVRLLTALQAGIGLDLARQHHPDLILLDVHLPDFNGDELLLRLLGDPQTSRVPVAVLSADATPSQVERFRALGAREYLTKPLDVAHFLGVLDRLLEEPGSGSAATPTGNGGNGPGP
jgi:CheY-like chemotaxis protein